MDPYFSWSNQGNQAPRRPKITKKQTNKCKAAQNPKRTIETTDTTQARPPGDKKTIEKTKKPNQAKPETKKPVKPNSISSRPCGTETEF